MSSLDTLRARLFDINAVQTGATIFDWDQQTYMPRGGAEARAAHVSILARMAHNMLVDDATLKALEGAKKEVSPDTDDAALVRVVQREVDQATKVPASLVEEKTKLGTEGHEIWVQARAENDFKQFLPCLERLVELCRQEAEYLGYKEHIYDALLDKFEEGATSADVRAMFEKIKSPLVNLVKQIKDAHQPDATFLEGKWDEAKQKQFTEMLVQKIGFDFNRGRQDTAPHPFCTNFSINDVRLTTRFKKNISSAIFGSLHEAGHGMYEQGSPSEWDRTPLAGGISLGVHESQSRLWENIIGRSRAFWKHFLPELREAFPPLSRIGVTPWYQAVNKVQPSLIRVEADEVTYNLHILIRFELECDMLTGALAVKDLPSAWNEKYQKYLGITPPTDSDGCLQDVHWSSGNMGYFPTYSMGNLLSYQIWNCLQRDLAGSASEREAVPLFRSGEKGEPEGGGVDALIEAGKFAPILEWLQEKIYRQGKRYTPKDLVKRVTGKPMGAEDYLAGITKKFGELYELEVASRA